MTDSIVFEIPGEPQGKGRPIFNSKRKTARTPENTRIYESLVALSCRNAFTEHGKNLTTSSESTGISVLIRAFISIPANKSKRFIKGAVEGSIKPMKKPDIDNICKTVLDGINLSGVWLDDRYVTSLQAYKVYTAENPRVEVTIGW